MQVLSNIDTSNLPPSKFTRSGKTSGDWFNTTTMDGVVYEGNFFLKINDDKNREGGFAVLPLHVTFDFFLAIRDGLQTMFGTQQEFQMKYDDVRVDIGNCQYFDAKGERIVQNDDDDDEDEDDEDEERASLSKTIEGICGMVPIVKGHPKV